jgi:hypothetical protein
MKIISGQNLKLIILAAILLSPALALADPADDSDQEVANQQLRDWRQAEYRQQETSYWQHRLEITKIKEELHRTYLRTEKGCLVDHSYGCERHRTLGPMIRVVRRP